MTQAVPTSTLVTRLAQAIRDNDDPNLLADLSQQVAARCIAANPVTTDIRMVSKAITVVSGDIDQMIPTAKYLSDKRVEYFAYIAITLAQLITQEST